MVPKLSAVRTRPAPKSQCQTRLTITRAVSGLSLAVSQAASSRRPLSLPGNGGTEPAVATRRKPRGAGSPRLCTLPRMWTCASSIFGSSTTDIASSRFGTLDLSRFSLASRFLSSVARSRRCRRGLAGAGRAVALDRQELHGVGDDGPLGPLVRDQDVALAVRSNR